MNKKTTFLLLALCISVITIYPGVFADEDNEEIVFPFIYGVSSNPASFDPLGCYDTTSGNIIMNLMDGLYAFNYLAEDGIGIEPRLAADLGTWNNDMDTLTISLRRDVTFWDGSKFTAEDVVWNFERIKALSENQLNNHASLWLDADGDCVLESITATGTYEVEMVLTEFTVAWESLLPFWGSSILKPFETGMEETLTLEDLDQVIGTGPFKLGGYTAGETTSIIRNDDYFLGAADIEKIEFQYFADNAALTDALLAHEIHVIRSILDTEWDAAIADPDIHVELAKGSCVYFYQMHVENIPWEVRKALQFTFNYSYIPTLAVTYPAHNHPIPLGMLGYNGDLDGLPIYDLDLARNYILNSEDEGIQSMIALHGVDEDTTDTEWVTIAQGDNPLYRANFTHYGTPFYTYIANFAQDIGVDIVDHQVGDWPTYNAWLNVPANLAGVQMTMGGWCPDYFDPVNMLEPMYTTGASNNRNGLQNASIDANLAALHSLGGDEKAAMVDTVVSQIIVEQAAAMYTIGDANLISWNQNAEEGIISGAEGLINPRGDKYFYPIDFALSTIPPGIPGFNMGVLIVGVLGISAFLIYRRK